MKQRRLVNQHDQRVEPKVEENKVGSMSCLDIMLVVGGIEMQLRRQSLVNSYAD